jgi:hypothetical protein
LVWSPNACVMSCATAAPVPGPSPVPAYTSTNLPFTPIEWACPAAQNILSCDFMYGDLMFTEPFFAATIEKVWNPPSVLPHEAR